MPLVPPSWSYLQSVAWLVDVLGMLVLCPLSPPRDGRSTYLILWPRGRRICFFEKLCENYSTECANCGGTIPPYSNVGILKADNGRNKFIHMTTQCNTPGNAFYGYWGKGSIREFIQIEACS